MNIRVHYCNDNQDINELKNLPRLMNKHPQVVWLQNCKHQINYVSLQTSYQEASNPETIQGILQTKLMPKMNNYEAENNSKYSSIYSHEIAEVVTCHIIILKTQDFRDWKMETMNFVGFYYYEHCI